MYRIEVCKMLLSEKGDDWERKGTIFKQVVDNLDLWAVIEAVNGKGVQGEWVLRSEKTQDGVRDLTSGGPVPGSSEPHS